MERLIRPLPHPEDAAVAEARAARFRDYEERCLEEERVEKARVSGLTVRQLKAEIVTLKDRIAWTFAKCREIASQEYLEQVSNSEVREAQLKLKRMRAAVRRRERARS